MATTVNMPQLGETVTEGTILRWAKKVGDPIATDEVLLEISTDKVDTEVPSPASGIVVELLVPEGETVAVGTALAVIAEVGEAQPSSVHSPPSTETEPAVETEPQAAPSQMASVQAPVASAQPRPPATTAAPPQPPTPAAPPAAAAPAPRPPVVTPPPVSASTEAGAREVLSPVVRKLAREHGVDLSAVPGTGEGGRITRRDLEGYLTAHAEGPVPVSALVGDGPEIPPGPAPVVAAPAVARPPTRVPSESPAPMPPPVPIAASGTEEVALDRLRVRIGENMIKAKQTAAHVWASFEVDYEPVERVRSAHQAKWKSEEGFSLTYLPFVARATIDALKEYPVVNSSFLLDEKKAIFHRTVNLGIAIDLNQKGLIVATIRNADGLRLVGLARKIRELAEKARSGKLEPDDVTGSTFSITNPGPFGSFLSAPIINVPNVGILSTDTVTKRPAIVTTPEGQDTIAIRHIGYLGLSWDHRAFDGSTAMLFLQRIKQNLETWDWNQELT